MGGLSQFPRHSFFLPLAAIAVLTLESCNLPVSSLLATETPAGPGPFATSQQALSSSAGGSVTSYHGCGSSAAKPDVYQLCINHDFYLLTPAFGSGGQNQTYHFFPAAGFNCTNVLVGPHTVNIQEMKDVPYIALGKFVGKDMETDLSGSGQLSLSGGGTCANGVMHITIRQLWTNGQALITVKCARCQHIPPTTVNIFGPANTNFTMDVSLKQAVSGYVIKEFPLQAPGSGEFWFRFTSYPPLPSVPLVPLR